MSAAFDTFAGDRTLLVTGDREGKLTSWDPQTGDRQSELTVTAPVRGALAVAQTPAGKVVIFADGNHQLHLWDPAQLTQQPDNHLKDGRTVVCGTGPDGPFAVVATFQPGVEVVSLDTMNRRPLFDPGYPIVYMALGEQPQAPWVAMAGLKEKAMYLVDLTRGNPRRMLPLPSAAAGLASHMVMGTPMFAVALEKGVWLWKLDTGRWKSRQPEPSAKIESDSPVRAIAFAPHPSGPLVVAGNDDGQVWLLDPAQGMHVFDLAAHTAPVRALACTAIGNRTLIASCGDDGIHVIELSADNWAAAGSQNQHPGSS